MKFTEEFTKTCLEAVINDLKNECILSIDDGTAKIFKDEQTAWVYMRKSIMHYDLPPEMLDFDTIGVMRVH